MSDIAKRIDLVVGQRIRVRRNMLGLTQEELAESLGISYQQVQKYETASNRVSAGRLFEIAAKLNSPISYFFEGLEETGAWDEPTAGTRMNIELVRNFALIADNPTRSALLGLIRDLARRGQ
jgi:transcriptional regulator with XRE-family HTH domain